MATTTRRRSGLQQSRPFHEPEQPKGPGIGQATTLANLGMTGAQIHDTTMKTRLTESGILNKKVTVPGSETQINIFEHTPTDKGQLGWGRNVPDRTQLNTEVVDQLKVWEDANIAKDPTGTSLPEDINPSSWETHLKEAGFNETEIANEFGYESADAFTNAKTTGNVKLKLSDGSTYEVQGDYYKPDPNITQQAGQVQENAMSQFKEFIHGPSGLEGYVPPGTEASISTVGETALTATGDLAQTTVSGTSLAPGSKVMTLANGNTVPLAGQTLAAEKATIASLKGGADAAAAAKAGSSAKVGVGAKVFGDVAGAHASAQAAGATAAEVAAAGAAAITPVGWTLIAIAIVATLVEADKHQKKKKKKKR